MIKKIKNKKKEIIQIYIHLFKIYNETLDHDNPYKKFVKKISTDQIEKMKNRER